MNNLLIIPAGKKSEYIKWNSDLSHVNFDLCILNYEKNYTFDDITSKNAKFLLNKQGMKWKIISSLYKEMPELLENYEYTMMMDDDIETTPSNINKFFNIIKKENFDLSQPALSEGSTFSYPETLKINCYYHITNMVEIMMPCFSKRYLKLALDDINNCITGIGWGLEGAWTKKYHAGYGRTIFGGNIGIIDCVDFFHKRPVGGFDSKIYEKYGDPNISLKHQEKLNNFKWSEMKFTTYTIIK
jgi:hypothetical protein